ncbi:LPS assembly lipoprotein LptE [Burkholderia stagnalis]|uniref:LPS-assembly lipoprotein LptE n=1 Tax=Burkholderia stagnalis TaxID=1503054 RepID=UPI00075DA127|nr:LPS assembly lipoprotein LptE [Burkholderia stagnalis]KVM93545.1 lipopolysaccharide-assembly family protein [Burkholderia stagnalis]KWE07825.1 lipopolysaccharide-assembly family protein [Burkholderia stagnalis]KWE10629.1 lipopolysaccharide-assembly family protein [Burkholderia stagnalis]KWO91421.1 lipopolysaccharide-assembly family protein [Burkholderia stagnalis]
MIRRSFLMLVGSAVALSACGFQLRGQQDYAFKHLLIVGAPPFVAARLTRLVEAGSDTKVVKLADDADAVLRMSESRGQGTLTLNKYGSVAEYALNYSMSYTLTNKDGTVLIPPSVIALNRAMTYSDQYTNAKAQEAEIIYADMQRDAVDQLMRRLAIVHSLNPAPEDVVPGIAPRAPLPPPPL